MTCQSRHGSEKDIGAVAVDPLACFYVLDDQSADAGTELAIPNCG